MVAPFANEVFSEASKIVFQFGRPGEKLSGTSSEMQETEESSASSEADREDSENDENVTHEETIQLRRLEGTIKHKRQGRVSAVQLPFRSSVVEQTDDSAVFVTSPASAMQKHRQHPTGKDIRRSSCMAAAVSCTKRIRQEDLEHSNLSSDDELQSGVKCRIAEATMIAHMKSMSNKLSLKCSPGYDLSQRLQTNEAGRSFTELYSITAQILEANMTLKPPSQRRHTIHMTDLIAYFSESPARSPKRHGKPICGGA